jgi:hypothetical protein
MKSPPQPTTDWASAPPDIVGSAFRHVVNLGHKEVVGYSKKLGFAENADQRNNLAKIIIRLLKTQIPHGILQVDIYQRHRPNGTPVPYREELILSLYEDGYDILGNLRTDKLIAEFLAFLYRTSNFEKALQILQGRTGCVFTGKTHEELIEQCTALKSYFPEDKVKRLYIAICRKYSWGPYAETTEPVTPPPKPAAGVHSMADLLQNFQNQP